MTQNSKRIAVILSVLILVIGFAAVTTTLVLNGGLLISESDDFKIIFTEAILDGKKDNSLISSDKKTITFESQELLDLNDKTTLEYMVANTSRNYDANVSVNCSISSDTNEYVYVRNNPSEMIVEAGTSKKGTIEVELIKVLTESKEVSLTCELVSTPIERDSLGSEYVTPGVRTLMNINQTDFKSDIYCWIEQRWGTPDCGYERTIEGEFQKAIWNNKYKYFIKKIIIEDKINIPADVIESWDVSENQDGSIMAYLVENEQSNQYVNYYTAYIQADGKIIANEDSSNLFSDFYSMTEIQGLEYLDTSKVKNMRRMFSLFFYGDTINVCNPIEFIDVSNFDTSNVIDMSYMFNGCGNLTSLDISNFDTKNVTDMNSMFSNCNSLTSLDLSNFDTNKVTDMSSMFSDCSNLTNLNLSNFDISNVTSASQMFSAMPSNAKVYVKDAVSQQWVLNTYNRPSAWTTENVIVKS